MIGSMGTSSLNEIFLQQQHSLHSEAIAVYSVANSS